MATDRIDYTMEGLPELLGKLDSVTEDIKYKGGRFALRRAAQVIRDQARANAAKVDRPQTPTNIAANIVERWNGRLFKRTGNLGFRVGVLGGARQYGNTRENVRKDEYRSDVAEIKSLLRDIQRDMQRKADRGDALGPRITRGPR